MEMVAVGAGGDGRCGGAGDGGSGAGDGGGGAGDRTAALDDDAGTKMKRRWR